MRNTIAMGAFTALATAQTTPPKLDATCADVVIFMARGNDAPYHDGRTFPLVEATCGKLTAEGKSCDYIDIQFDATLGGDYCAQVAEGARNGISQITAFNEKCPCSHIVVNGYSQGAHVAGDVLGGPGGCEFVSTGLDNTSPAGNAIAAALLWGDVMHTAHQSYNVLDGANKQSNPRKAADLARLNRYAPVLRSYCAAGDPVCAGGAVVADHLNYFELYTDEALSWFVSKIDNVAPLPSCAALSSSSASVASSTAPASSSVIPGSSAGVTASQTTTATSADVTSAPTPTKDESSAAGTACSTSAAVVPPFPTPIEYDSCVVQVHVDLGIPAEFTCTSSRAKLPPPTAKTPPLPQTNKEPDSAIMYRIRLPFTSLRGPPRLAHPQCQALHAKSQTRLYQQVPFGRNTGPQYKRFTSPSGGLSGLLFRWAARPTFYRDVGIISAGTGGIYLYNLESVPVSGRRRFNMIPPQLEEALGASSVEQVRQEYRGRILPDSDGRVRAVKRVLERLVPFAEGEGLQGMQWEVCVIDSPEQNAFVAPGGKVFVFTGILPLCGGEDGIAAVLGHEIAHVVAHHTAERMSRAPIILLGVLALSMFDISLYSGKMLIDLFLSMPASRKHEAEADYIGLLMMAQGCYRPEAAMELWARMEKVAGGGGPPALLSTHPSHHDREEKIREWLPQAREAAEKSECKGMGQFADQFSTAFGSFGRW
ncbi:carbohydrate esterase family 5 protein [Stemphylium lycopersici]|nr:carbohydrate esterase family 5 protein [Stemphylium lycopersici]